MEILISALLLLAAAHCTLSIFYDNLSYLDLTRYAAGMERNPYQERVAMVPLLRIAAHSSVLQHAAAFLDARERRYPGRGVQCTEPFSAEKLASVLIGLMSVIAAIGALSLWGLRAIRTLWWTAPALAIAMLYASYAARFEQNFWYPYDLPHMFLFGLASVATLTGRPRLMLLAFALDLPMRETSIYLVPLTLCFLPQGWTRRQVASLASAMLAAWIIIRALIAHTYAHHAAETGSRLLVNLHSALFPYNWPAFSSLLGFMLIPIWLGRRYLTAAGRTLLWVSLPCLIVTAWFSIWSESRAALEWTLPYALLAALEFHAACLSARTGTASTESPMPS